MKKHLFLFGLTLTLTLPLAIGATVSATTTTGVTSTATTSTTAAITAQTTYDSFRPGELWYDTAGEVINAHGGGILHHGGKYYWFGEHKAENSNSALVGVMCYSSDDLYNWTNEGVALAVSDDPSSPIVRESLIERPKVIHNARTGKFVMYFHNEIKGRRYDAAQTGVAVSDRVTGPYRLVRSARPNPGVWPLNMTAEQKLSPAELPKPGGDEWLRAIEEGMYVRRDLKAGQMSRDMTLYVDDDGKAYHIYASEENRTLHVAELTDDYLDYTGRYVRVQPGGWNEAPALFKKDGRYYMITSGCTGWRPNAARLLTADSIMGEWTLHPNPARGDDSDLTYHSQSTFILPAPGKPGEFIFMADRWRPDHPIDGRYVWLPILFENGLPVLRWVDSWTLDDLDDRLVTWQAPEGASLNDDFEVRVRQGGGAWTTIPTYMVLVDEVRETDHHYEEASMSTFDFSGTVEMAVTSRAGKITGGRVRPLSYDIPTIIKGNTMTFTLDRPANLSVEVNGDIFHNLHLFANPLEGSRPSPSDPDVIYLGPGLHTPEGGKIEIPSGKTLYLAGGAVLKGQIVVRNAQNVKVLGRGVIDHQTRMGIEINRSRNVLVEGLVTTQCATGGSDGVAIHNVKAISFYQWGDGMNVFASNNVLFDGVFCRNSDDCTTVYATRKGYEGGCRNITMRNSTLWADVAHPIFIGIHGNAGKPDTIEEILYENIDILDHKEKQVDYQGCLAINAGDNNTIRRVRFENIRVEDFRQGQLVNLRIFYNTKYCAAPGLAIEDVLFKDVTYNGTRSELSVMAGYDPLRKVKNVRFENLRINGVHISDDMPGKPGWYKTGDMARIHIGEHVEDVRFY